MERNFLLNYHQEESQEIGDEYYTDAFGCDYYVNEYYDIWFALYDMDRNGIPELITYSGYGEGAGGAAYAFTVENGMMKYLGLVGTRESLLFCYDSDEYPGIFESGGHMGSYYTAYSYLENGEIKGESVEEHEGWYNDNEEFVESNYVYTDDAGLLDLYQNGKPYGIGEYTYEQIQMMGWDQFLLTVGRDQRTQTANENNQSGAEENSNNGVDYQQSSVVSMNRADWTGYDWNNAKDFRDVLFDSEIYSGEETYLRILQKNESGIRHHILYCDKYALEKYGYGSGIIFYDITHDGIPEMLFIKAYLEENNDGKDCYEGDLYIYTNDGTQTKCMLSIPDFYCCDWNGPYYSILYDLNNPSLLYLQYRDPYVWQVEYVLNGSATRGTTYRAISPDGDDGTLTSHFYINGTEVSETEAETYWIHPDYPSYCILSSMYYPSFVQGIDYDAAVTFLSDASSVIGSQHGTYPRQAKTLRNNVYLYAGTNQDSRQDGIIRNAGTEVTVLGVACDNYDSPWYFVRTNNGEKGYVPYEVLSYVSGETSSVVTSYVSLNDGADNILFYAKTTKATNVRVSADKKSDLVVKISDKGTEVTVLEKVTGADNKEWYRIQLPDGTVGYARYDFFRKVDK